MVVKYKIIIINDKNYDTKIREDEYDEEEFKVNTNKRLEFHIYIFK